MKPLALALLLAAADVSPARDAPSVEPPRRYVLEVQQQRLALSITVNEVPVQLFELENAQPIQIGYLESWIHAGENRVRVRGRMVSPADLDKDRPGTWPRLDLWVRVEKGEGQLRKAVATLAWPPPGVPPPTSFDQEIRFVSEHPPCSELWALAEEVKLDAKARRAITDLVVDLHGAYDRHDEERVMTLTEVSRRESARCSGEPRAGDPAHLRRALDWIVHRHWSMAPLARSELEFRLLEGGRLVWVTAKGKPLIAPKAGQFGGSMHVFVARVGGRWIVAR
jgi:hypothetical protein